MLLLLSLIAAVSIDSRGAPPAIAEFAPQAQKQITEAPVEQTADSGQGEGGAATGEPGATPSDEPTASEAPTEAVSEPAALPPRAAVRRCVGNPPRQIEDPQSPPCVPFWKGDNGGATWKGVTATEVRIGIWEDKPEIRLLEQFFNERFEFYGRKLTFVLGDASPEGDGPDGMRIDAALFDELNVFGVASYAGRRNPGPFYDELTRRQIVGVMGRAPMIGEQHLRDMRPYQWSYLPGVETIGRNIGEWACKTLAGLGSEHARGRYVQPERKFGIMFGTNPDGSKPDISGLRGTLAACGLTDLPEVEISNDSGQRQETFQQAVLQFNDALDPVTSVICMCHSNGLVNVQAVALAQGYTPEWIVSTYQTSDEDTGGSGYAQANQVFGLTFWNKRLPSGQNPWDWAVDEVDPGHDWQTDLFDQTFQFTYGGLLLMAAGLQMAGPNLTPETFEQGLFNAQFPNPGADGPPLYQAAVDFGPGDYVMNDSGAVIWWNPSVRSYQGSQGTFCYVDLGKRWSVGGWREGRQNLFDTTGHCK